MTKICVVTHGGFGAGVLDSLDMITGDAGAIDHLSLTRDGSLDELHDAIQGCVSAHPDEDILLMVDLFGATPFNASVMNARDCCHEHRQIRVICGLNLPMLLEASTLVATMPIEQLYDHLLEVGKASIVGWQYPTDQEAAS